jgi:hypothetical protein
VKAARYMSFAIGLAASALALVAMTRYSGSAIVFVVFNVCFLACVGLLFPQPRLYVYTFLALLLALGLWAKTIVHTLWSLPFLEPVGDFGNTPAEWDHALLAMSAGALGLALARAVHLWVARRRPGEAMSLGPAPSWFVRHRKLLWIVTLGAVVGVNAANLHFAFFQIGVNPKLLLPLRLHILVAWLVNIGFALAIATLLWWDYRTRAEGLGFALAAPLVEALVSAASTLSRIGYLVHAVPYGLTLWEQRRRALARALRPRQVMAFAAGFVVLFAAATLAVFALRLQVFPQIDRSTGLQGDASVQNNLAVELPQLVVRRWVGLEPVLAVGALPGRGSELLFAALTDSAKGAGDSLYQRVSKLQPYHVDPKRFTFLTNAGPVAVFLFSGSYAVVFLGMALVMLALAFTEEAARVLTGNPFLLAVGGAAMANVASQTTFFYLTAVFLLQFWVAVAFIAAAERVRVH